MKVLLINGSPHAKGCTFTALNEVAASLEKEGIETEMNSSGHQATFRLSRVRRLSEDRSVRNQRLFE